MSDNGVQQHRIRYGRSIIPFELEFRRRKTLEISVYPDTTVKVKAPVERDVDEVIDKVKKRGSWILEQRYFFSLYLPRQSERKYISGESHLYLGKQYRLKIYKSDHERVLLKRGIIEVYVRNRKDSQKVKYLLEDWYRLRAHEILPKRIKLCREKINKYRVKNNKTQIRKMTKRWGSCSKDGRLILNYQLIKAPSHCIDYVIMHELCHLKFFDHSKSFYNLLNRIMPDWERRKKRLEQVVI
jgi:predicted metal-dependent hydrolase